MSIEKQIEAYFAIQPEPKRADFESLHRRILQVLPDCKLWFLDGKDSNGKIVSNPQIGYGLQTIKSANGQTKPFFQIGISTHTSGISVYIMGLEDKKYLSEMYREKIGKASITSYCIRFKTLKDIDLEILEKAIKDGVNQST